MHRSTFTYNLSRPYPYRWFTWVIIIGGVVATALFSVVSVAANGYDTALVTVSNPNETEHPSTPAWYQQQPWSLANRVAPKCQDQVFTTGSYVYTTALSLKHFIQGISRISSTVKQALPSLAYHYNPFENCQVQRITFAAWSPGQFNFSMPVSIKLLAHAESTSYADDIVMDWKSSPSWVIWGSALQWPLLSDCLSLLVKMSDSTSWTAHADYFFTPTTDSNLEVVVSSTSSVTTQDIRSGARIGDTWLPYQDSRTWTSLSPNLTNSNVSLSTWSTNFGLDALSLFGAFSRGRDLYPQPWNVSTPIVALALRVDHLAKLLYASLMSDFGQESTTNMFANPQNLWDYVHGLDVIRRAMGDDTFMSSLAYHMGKDRTYPPYEFNDTTRQNVDTLFSWGKTTIPSVKATFLNTLYLCQVPKMKPMLSLIFAVVIADLVFLQTLWIIINFVSKSFLERRDPTANYCEGCADIIHNNGLVSDLKLMSPVPQSNEDAFGNHATITSSSTDTVEMKSWVRRRPVEAPPQLPEHQFGESTTLLEDVQTPTKSFRGAFVSR